MVLIYTLLSTGFAGEACTLTPSGVRVGVTLDPRTVELLPSGGMRRTDLPVRPLDVWLGMADAAALITWTSGDMWRVDRVLFGEFEDGKPIRVDARAASTPHRVGCPVLLVANRGVDGYAPVEPRGLLSLQPDGSLRFEGFFVEAVELPASAEQPARVVLSDGLPTKGRVLRFEELVALVDAYEP